MDCAERKSGHLMLITPERVFYAGLLGRPRQRCSGAFHIYVAIEGDLSLSADGRERQGELLAVPPDVGHTISSHHRSVICVTIEPESVRDGVLNALTERLAGAGTHGLRPAHPPGLCRITATQMPRRHRLR